MDDQAHTVTTVFLDIQFQTKTRIISQPEGCGDKLGITETMPRALLYPLSYAGPPLQDRDTHNLMVAAIIPSNIESVDQPIHVA